MPATDGTSASGVVVTEEPQVTSQLERSDRSESATRDVVRRRAFAVVYLTVFALGTGLVLNTLATRHGLYGVTEYDDGVYFGAALRLISGSLAYRDFVMIQPPGIAIVMVPFAFLAHAIGTRDAMAVVRVFTALVTGFNALLVAWLLRYRGIVASAVGGVALAIFPPAYAADHTLLLEPYLVLFCLLAVAVGFQRGELVRGRRLLLAGILFGIAGSIKAWAILPFLAFAVVVLVARWKEIWRALLGAALGVTVPCIAFFVGSPRAFYHDIVTTQFARESAIKTSIAERLWSITGFGDWSLPRVTAIPVHTTYVIAFVIGAALLIFSVVPTVIGKAKAFEVFAILATVGAILLMLYPSQFYDHYSYFPAAFMTCLVGLSAGRVAALVGSLRARSSLPLARDLLVAVSVVALLVGAVGTAVVVRHEASLDEYATIEAGDPGPIIESEIPKGACVIADAEIELILANRAIPNNSRCPAVIDATGTWLTIDPHNAPEPTKASGLTTKVPKLVAYWKSVFKRVDYVLLSNPRAFRIPWSRPLCVAFVERFEREPGSARLVFVARKVPLTAKTITNRAIGPPYIGGPICASTHVPLSSHPS